MKIILQLWLLVSVSTTGFAQTARQGEQQSDPTEFHSPMVLEAPFVAASPEFWKGTKEQGISSYELWRLRRFHCEGVSITSILLYPKETPDDQVTTRIDVGVRNPGHDKFVKLLFRLFNGDQMVGEASVGPFKDKEGAVAHQSATIIAKKADLRVDPLTTLRITMTNWDY
ncbi:MAG: hypothetical protein M3167_02480 [Acidobacteriota bacterium]|nr:hypothetical protein [Acidobacteriota bacterium]